MIARVVVCVLFILKKHGGMLNFYLWLIVQIVLESLPVSSSGHLYLLEKIIEKNGLFLPALLQDPITYKKISFFIHAPMVVIIALFFFEQWWFLFKNIFSCYRQVLKLGIYVAVANSATISMYGLWHVIRVPTSIFLPYGFIITALALASLYWVPERSQGATLFTAFIVGLVQGCALLPGISRLAVTYVVSRWLGLSYKRAFEFSFAIQFPLIALASFYGLVTMPPLARVLLFSWQSMFVMICASIGSYMLLKWGYQKARNNTFQQFAWYMILPILLSLFI